MLANQFTSKPADVKIDIASPQSLSPAPRYNGALDGLRAFAVAAVLFYHFRFVRFPGAIFGVDLFYSLSGFLITGLIINEFHRTGELSIINFYKRRARRLLPALVFMLSGYFVAALFVRPSLKNIVVEVMLGISSMVNWTRALDYRMPRDLAHLWSLSIEFQFCLLWAPLCYLVLKRYRSISSLAVLCLVVVCAVQIERAILIAFEAPSFRIYGGTDTRLDAFALAGFFRCMLALRSTGAEAFRRFLFRWATPIGAGAIIAHLYFGNTVSIWEWTHFQWLPISIALTCCALIASLYVAPEKSLAKFFSLTPLRAIGVISYGLYLWHYPILRLAPLRSFSVLERGLIVFIASVALATTSYLFIEKPFLKRKP